LLSPGARAILLDADAGNRRILVPSITLVEAVYLGERDRVQPELLDRMLSYVQDEDRPYDLVVLDDDIVRAMRRVPRDAVPDMPDRIIVATAFQLGLPLISRDERIRRAGVVPVVW
jgi:predicted nucleic acid-binding protein